MDIICSKIAGVFAYERKARAASCSSLLGEMDDGSICPTDIIMPEQTEYRERACPHTAIAQFAFRVRSNRQHYGTVVFEGKAERPRPSLSIPQSGGGKCWVRSRVLGKKSTAVSTIGINILECVDRSLYRYLNSCGRSTLYIHTW